MAASQGEHAKVYEGLVINNRYVIQKEVGCGNFSKVYRAKDSTTNEIVALKLLKKEYANDAAFENDMLKVLGAKDASHTAKVSKMHSYFSWNRYPCFVMPLRGPALRSRKLGIDKGNVAISEAIHFAKEIIGALKFVHFDCKMVHTDLKPENILLDHTATGAEPAGLGNGWSLCDFGSASLWRSDKMDSDLISTRPYRAPEVVLGMGWSYPADTWSLGCILYEVVAGSRLFEVHDDNTHLLFMESRLGRFPDTLTLKSKHSKKYFDSTGKFLRPAAVTKVQTPRAITESLKDHPLFLDLIQSMLHYEPAQRIRMDQALSHPLFDTVKPTLTHAVKSESPAAKRGSSERSTPESGRFRALPPLMTALAELKIGAKDNRIAAAIAAAQHGGQQQQQHHTKAFQGTNYPTTSQQHQQQQPHTGHHHPGGCKPSITPPASASTATATTGVSHTNGAPHAPGGVSENPLIKRQQKSAPNLLSSRQPLAPRHVSAAGAAGGPAGKSSGLNYLHR